MAALNGRIHQISEPLRVPAPDVFSLLSSHPQLTGWTDWVELVGGAFRVRKQVRHYLLCLTLLLGL